jgi:hypothetical protein
MQDTSMSQEPARFEPPARSTRSGATGALELEGGPLVRRDLVRWGPVIAGLVCVIATLAILSALGLAIGLSAVEPSGSGLGEISTGAWIWGIASGVVAFFLGGLVAGLSSAVGGRSRGLLNGVLVGAASITATLVLVGVGAGTLLGAGATALGDVVNVGSQLEIGQTADNVSNAVARAESSAWGSFIGLSLAVILAGLGGVAGARNRADNEPTRH